MKIEFKDTFFESVEKLVWYDTKLWKVWEFIRRGIPTFVGNVYKFRRELYEHRWYDYHYTLQMLYRSLTIMVEKLETNGMEVDSSRNKKTTKIRRAIEILKSKIDDDYVDRAELVLGKVDWPEIQFEKVEDSDSYRLIDNDTDAQKKHIRKVFALARKLEEREWKELWKIFEGQNINEYSKLSKSLTSEEHKTRDIWNEWFDGSGMRGWWD